MFNKKLKRAVFGRDAYWIHPNLGGGRIPRKLGLVDNVKRLEKENEKLKGVVAELCDYVYGNVDSNVDVLSDITRRNTIDILKLKNPVTTGRKK